MEYSFYHGDSTEVFISLTVHEQNKQIHHYSMNSVIRNVGQYRNAIIMLEMKTEQDWTRR